ncbi:MAG: TetR/AcrR family transcriptional regulator [Thermoanaerobaculia bacterium]
MSEPLRHDDGATPAQTAIGRGEARRQAILEAARDLFLERGFEKTSVSDVVRRSGGSLATLYALFGSKEGLFEAIVEEVAREIVAPFESLDFAGRPVEEALALFGERFLGLVLCPSALRWHRMCVNEGPNFPELRAAMVRIGPGRIRERLAGYLGSQARSGRLRLEDPLVAAQHFLALVKSESYFEASCGEPVEIDAGEIQRQVARAVGVFLHGYLAEA